MSHSGQYSPEIISSQNRSYHDHYDVEIQLSNRKDVEMLLGPEAIATKQRTTTSFIEILCSELVPVTIKNTSKKEFLTVTMQYRTMVESGGKIRPSKPGGSVRYAANQIGKEVSMRRIRTAQLEKRKVKATRSGFDHSNILRVQDQSEEEPQIITDKRKRKPKSMMAYLYSVP